MSARHNPDTASVTGPKPYRGPDRRGVARFVIPAALPSVILVVVAVLWITVAGNARWTVGRITLEELSAIAATLALLAGVACILRWRLDGVARGWWCGWGLIVFGVGQLAFQPLMTSTSVGIELGSVALSLALFARAVLGPEIDASIRLTSSLTLAAGGVAIAFATVVVVDRIPGRHDAELAIVGGAWVLVAALAAWRQRDSGQDAEAGWIIPVALALGCAELVPLGLDHAASGALAARWFEMAAMGMACVGALGGLVRGGSPPPDASAARADRTST